MAFTFDTFTLAYLHAAAFTEDPNPGQGEYPEPAQEDFVRAFLLDAVQDCAGFQAQAGDRIADDLEHAGRDFWYTRNGHGCGFWDGDWPEPIATELTTIAKRFGAYENDVLKAQWETADQK